MITPEEMRARLAARKEGAARRAAGEPPGQDSGAGRRDGRAGATVSPWRGTTPELLIAAVLVAAVGVAGYATAGWAGLAVVAVATTAIAMAVLRVLLPAAMPDQARTAREKAQARTLSGYSHRRFVVQTASESLGFYQGELRPLLEHLLAARLAERHGVNLYTDPEAGRRLLCRSTKDADLWPWIDPAQGSARPETATRDAGPQPGIPRRTLARLIDRLERI